MRSAAFSWLKRRSADGAAFQCIVKTPPALRAVLIGWPLISDPMAETLTEARCAAFQRSLAWMEVRGPVREVTGQARFRMWQTKN